ncbi:MAG: RNA 2',3'-cyclic phosphodiesterase [Hyphomicrobiaceae bacterium]
MPRLFVGLQIPEAHRLRLSLIRGPLPGARWVEPDNFHMTLFFAGDIDNPQADELVKALDQVAWEPFDLRFTELGAFGGNDPRVVWAGLDGGEGLQNLARGVARAARTAGLPPETRKFVPHVTLARLANSRAEAVARFLASRGRLDMPPFPVDRFVLFSSRPNQGGGPYVVEEAFEAGM